jgi:anti-sigma factor ChrR (cupin superfamily)
MKHFSEQETHDMASEYALGSLSQHDAESFEQHLAEGCDVCRELLGEFQAVVGHLGFSASAVTPSPSVRERLLKSLRNGDDKRPAISAVPYQSALQHMTIRSSEGDWVPMCEGVMVKHLFNDAARNTKTVLVKMAPGAVLARHHHSSVEECLMLEGELFSGDETLRPGDYQVSLAGSDHDRISTVNGALFLIVGPPAYEPLESL